MSKEKWTEIFVAHCSRYGYNLDKAKEALKNGADINGTANIYGITQTALHGALKSGDHDNIEFVLNQPGIDVAILNGEGKTPLEVALDRQLNETCVSSIINKMSPAQIKDHMPQAERALIMASKHNGIDLITMLLAKGANVNATYHATGKTALYFAAKDGRETQLDLLIANGADINKADSIGETALHIAAKNNHYKIIDKLLAYGADFSIQNTAGQTPLQLTNNHNIQALIRKQRNKIISATDIISIISNNRANPMPEINKAQSAKNWPAKLDETEVKLLISNFTEINNKITSQQDPTGVICSTLSGHQAKLKTARKIVKPILDCFLNCEFLPATDPIRVGMDKVAHSRIESINNNSSIKLTSLEIGNLIAYYGKKEHLTHFEGISEDQRVIGVLEGRISLKGRESFEPLVKALNEEPKYKENISGWKRAALIGGRVFLALIGVGLVLEVITAIKAYRSGISYTIPNEKPIAESTAYELYPALFHKNLAKPSTEVSQPDWIEAQGRENYKNLSKNEKAHLRVDQTYAR